MRLSRRLAVVVALLAAFSVVLPAGSAGAADTGYELTGGWFVLGATAKCPNAPARDLNAKHAAAFIESWYLATILGKLPEAKPPALLPKCTFVASERIRGADGHLGSFQFHAFYVSQGTKAWVGLPRQEIGPGAFVPVEKWYAAPPRTTLAWQGKANPLTGPAATTTTTTIPLPPVDEGSGSSTGWIVGGISLAVLLAGAVALFVRTRRRATTT